MNHARIVTVASAFLLTACNGAVSETVENNLENPLYAEWYYQDVVEQMVNFVIQQDPLIEDAEKKDMIDERRKEGLRLSQEASQRQLEGARGMIKSDFGYAVGEVLLLENTLYFGTDFDTVPGIDLHVYLSTMLDPRDEGFPDETSVDLGPVKDPYAAQSYDVPPQEEGASEYRSVALWDSALGRVFGFAQLQRSVTDE